MFTLTALLLVTHFVYVVLFVLLQPLGVLIASLAVNVNVNVPLVHAACAILHVGAVVSTVTALLGHVAAFLFVALSATLLAGNVNVTVPFLFANAVYVNVYFFPFVTSLTLALLKLTYALLNVIAQLVKLVVAIHANVSVHVNSIVHVAPAFTGVLLGLHQLQLGTVLSNLILLLV